MPTDHSLSVLEILPLSKNDPRLEVRPSPIHGMGIFTLANIQEGEIIIVWGGTLFAPEDIQAGKALEHSYCAIDEDVFLGHTPEQGTSVDDYINHSCDPNVWMLDEITLAAKRDINAGEEVTADLAMWWEPDDIAVPSWECYCGTALCRKIFTSRDWRRPELHERYGEHFLPYINLRIRQLYPSRSQNALLME
jgi:SET domain-containing protein